MSPDAIWLEEVSRNPMPAYTLVLQFSHGDADGSENTRIDYTDKASLLKDLSIWKRFNRRGTNIREVIKSNPPYLFHWVRAMLEDGDTLADIEDYLWDFLVDLWPFDSRRHDHETLAALEAISVVGYEITYKVIQDQNSEV